MAKSKLSRTASVEVIKKGKYRVFNGSEYETVHLQTSAEQVIESETKKFVSQVEKNAWNAKADASHNHDTVYAKIGDSHTKEEINNLLSSKSDVGHTHAASNVIVDSTHRFVTDAEKSRWNNTYTTTDVDSKISKVSDAVQALEIQNSTDHSTITKGYQDADKIIDGKVTTVQDNLDKAVEDLTALINSGGTANTELATRVDTIEKTTIPAVKKQITDLDSKLTGVTDGLETNKADKAQVQADIAAAKNTLQANINLKADKTFVDEQLKLKANAEDVYTKDEMDISLGLKADKSYVDTELGKKVNTTTFTSELAKKANAAEVNTALESKASVEALQTGLSGKAEKVHRHNVSDIDGLGNVATLNTGVKSGNIPVLNAQGKLETSILPSIAINETYSAASASEAMDIEMQIGDILVLTNDAREAAIAKQEQGEAVIYQVSNPKSSQELSDEYTTYIASGRMTYLCVDPTAETFEERFKPLQSSGDTVTSAEVQAALALKLNISDFNSYKSEVSNNLNLKADKATTYTKEQVDASLSGKVDKVSGKQLSSNDFTDALKVKLEGIAEGANNYVHPTGDGNLHVPATGTSNNGKFLMAGSSEGATAWTSILSSHVTDSATKRFVTDEQIKTWTAKADAIHEHDQYRSISDSFNKSQTTAEINKMKTIISTTQPTASSQVAGAVWIEEQV